jgi:hypothetical protein
VLSELFRGLMLQKLLAAHAAGKLQFFGQHAYRRDFIKVMACGGKAVGP